MNIATQDLLQGFAMFKKVSKVKGKDKSAPTPERESTAPEEIGLTPFVGWPRETRKPEVGIMKGPKLSDKELAEGDLKETDFMETIHGRRGQG